MVPRAAHVVVRTAHTMLRDLTRLVLPVSCPGCGRWDELLCAACAARLTGPVRRCEQDVPRLDEPGVPPMPVWARAAYAGPTRGVVVAWKDRGRADLTAVLVPVLRDAARDLAPVLREAAGGTLVHVVPVPSSPGARRRRGADLVAVLAAGVVDGLRAGGVAAVLSPELVRRRGGRDQVGLGARARGRNTTGSVQRRRGRPSAPWTTYLLVDDVVTTGGTVAACAQVLSGSAGLVLGALVLAATPPPGQRNQRVPRTAPEG